MDVLEYQLEPTIQALSTTRPRILIADAVGIGKTLEAGILVSELIVRGRGRRILVLAVKAMLEQFQKEFWNRFSILLTRLDSDGINRLQQRIPASHNPFLYVDKAIISIDTLKQDVQYRDYLNSAYWDKRSPYIGEIRIQINYCFQMVFVCMKFLNFSFKGFDIAFI